MTKWLRLSTVFSYANARLLIVPMVLIVAISTTIFLSVSASAAPGINKTVGFQGRLQRSSGAVVPDGYYNIQFKIYQDGSGDVVNNPGGDLKWTESHVNDNGTGGIRVKNGYFSVDLGSKTAFGNDVDWNQDTLWLSMNVAGTASDCTTFNTGTCIADGEMLPMKRLTATPFAINSSQLDGKTADKFVQIGQGVQADASDNSSIFINKTGNGGLMQLQNAGTDVLSIAGNGNITMGSNAPQSISIAGSATGDGQSLTLESGSATTGNANGGNLVLAAGSGNGTGSDGQIVMSSDVTIGAGKTITMVGGATSLRPTSPDEGMFYFDTETKQMLVYANGKWGGSGGESNSLRTVAAFNSSQENKDSANYVADGVDDQDQIKAAIAALPPEGGTVALLGGTYNISATVDVNKSNITLQGQGGVSTTLKRVWNSATSLEGVITIPSGYSHIEIRSLNINGDKAAYSSTNNHGIRVGNIDTACGSAVTGIIVDNNQIVNTGGSGVRFGGGTCRNNNNHRVINNTISGSGVDGIADASGGVVERTNIINNTVSGSVGNGISVRGDGTSIDRNKTTSNGGYGISTNGTATNNTITGNAVGGVRDASVLTGNVICSNTGYGYHRQEGVVNLIENNIICSNGSHGMFLSGGSLKVHSIASNDIYDNASSGITITGGSSHVINNNNIRNSGGTGSSNSIDIISATKARVMNNTITDTAGTGCAIRLSNGSDHYISNNTYSGIGASCVSDNSTGATYANQRDASGKLINRSSGGFSIQNNAGADALTIDGATGDVAVAGNLSTGNINANGDVVIQADTDSASTFQVQNAAGASVLNVDTESGTVSTGALSMSQSESKTSSLWSNTTVPQNPDGGDSTSAEIGVRFQSNIAGKVTGVKFYKHANNTGTHIGNLWDAAGNNLATVEFEGETASGWQQATFSAPVSIEADTEYIVSYFAPNGRFSNDPGYFADVAHSKGPLTAPRDIGDVYNGMWSYTGTSAFPSNGAGGNNYWVDVMFQTDASTSNISSESDLNISAGGDMTIGRDDRTLSLQGNNINIDTDQLKLQNADGVSMLSLNASTNRLRIGVNDTVGTLLVLDTKTNTGDPSGVNGAMYYNSSAGAFRCYQAGSWRDCITPLPIYKTTASDTAFDNNETDIDDLEFNLAADTKYHYKFVIKHDTVNDNEGAGFGIASPSGSTGINWCVNTTVEIAASTPGPSSTAYCGTGDVSTVIDGSEIPGEKFVSVMEGYIETGSNSGNLKLRALAEGSAGGKVLSSSFGIVQIVQ